MGTLNDPIPRIVEFLLKFNADVNGQDNSNISPLHLAVSSPFQPGYPLWSPNGPPLLWRVIQTTKLLLKHGANPHMQNDKGETPFQVALRREEQEIIDVLSDYAQNDWTM